MDPFEDLLFVDIETGSLADLPKVGAWPYSQHPSTEVYCISFGVMDDGVGETLIWSPANGESLPEHLVDFIVGGGILIAHNAGFEKSIWTNILQKRYGFPPVASEQWRDTQATGLALNLPKTLEGLALSLGCPAQKDMEGASLMKEMATTVERKGSSYSYPLATTDNLERLGDYCELDVLTTRDAYKVMPQLSLMEQRVWFADQAINARGIYLDREFAKKCLEITQERQAQLDDQAFTLTGGELCSASAPQAMKPWLKAQGVQLRTAKRPNGSSSEVLDSTAMQVLLDGDLPPLAREVLENRQEAGKVTSLAKLQRVASVAATDDNRLRHALQYQAAHTGRWASYGLQLHNLPKVTLSNYEIELARVLVEQGTLDDMLMFFDRPLQVLSQLLRSVVTAAPGNELIAADYSAIEARVVAWLAGQHDIVALFADDQDVYTYTAMSIGSENRQLGKVCQLMLGFQAGAVKFASTAASWGVPLTYAESRDTVTAWRRLNSDIVVFWEMLEVAAHTAVANPGEVFSAGDHINCWVRKSCLHIALPSGRVLRYWRPSLVRTTKKVPIVNDDGEVEEIEINSLELQFFQVAPNKTGMQRTSTYSGKLCENVTQAVARDLLAEALVKLEAAGYPVVLHVHDSIAAEVPAGTRDVDEFCYIMEEKPTWAVGLPVAAEGYRDTRFRG